MEKSKTKYLCQNCGGEMKFDIKKQKMVCEYCMTEMDEEKEEKGINEYDLEEGLNKASTIGTWDKEVKTFECESCGASIVINSEETSTSCSFCGSSHITKGHEEAMIKPEAILPFKIEEHEAKERLGKWIKTRFLSPKDLKHLYSSEKIKPIYVPYWTFDAMTNSYYVGEGGTYYYVKVQKDGKTVNERRIKWSGVSGRVELFFDDIQVNASKNFGEFMMNNIEPYNMNNLVPYNQKYLAGYVAEKYTKGIRQCFDLSKLEMNSKIRAAAKNKILMRFDAAKVNNVDVRYSDCKFKHILLPVWTATYDYNGKKYTYVINGETGKVSGSVPYSMVKIVALIVIAILIIMFIYMRG